MTDAGDAAAPTRDPVVGALLVAGGAVAVGGRAWLARSSVGLEIPDEAAYVAIARHLGGGGHFDMGTSSTYSFGYGALLAPLFRTDVDPFTSYRAGLALNALLGLVTLGLAFLLARRLTPFGPRTAAVAATVVAVAPAAATQARWLWSESLLTPAFLALLLLVLRAVERPTWARALAVSAAGIGAYAVHGRVVAAVAVAAVVVAVACVRRGPGWPTAVATLAATVVGIVAVSWAYDRINLAIHEPGGSTSQVEGFTGTSPTDVAMSGVGQLWYLLATTAGVAGFGLVALVRSLRRPSAGDDDGRPGPVPDRAAGAAVALLVGAAAATSIVFIAGQPRPDHVVYGRYLDTVAAPLLLLGLAELTRRSWRALAVETVVVIATVVAATALLRARRGEQLDGPGLAQSTIVGTVALVGGDRSLDLVAATRVAVAVTVAVAAVAVLAAVAARSRRAVAVLVAVAAVATAGIVTTERRWPPVPGAEVRAANVVDVRSIVPAGATIRYRTDLPGMRYFPFFQYQLFLPDHHVVRDVAPGRPDSPFSFAEAAHGREPGHLPDGARMAWIDPALGIALWVDPGPEQDDLAARGRLLPADFPAALPAEAIGALEPAGPFTVVDGRLRGRVTVHGPGAGAPWPANARGRAGTARLAVVIEGPGCPCPEPEGRVDLPVQLDPGDPPLDLAVDVALGAPLEPGGHRVVLRVVQEGYAPLTVAVEVALDG